jgi:hypothetical protein
LPLSEHLPEKSEEIEPEADFHMSDAHESDHVEEAADENMEVD